MRTVFSRRRRRRTETAVLYRSCSLHGRVSELTFESRGFAKNDIRDVAERSCDAIPPRVIGSPTASFGIVTSMEVKRKEMSLVPPRGCAGSFVFLGDKKFN